MLVFIDQYGRWTSDESRGIGSHGIQGRGIVEVDDLGAEVGGEVVQEVGLADGARSLEEDQRLFGHPIEDDLADPPFDPFLSRHVPTLALLTNLASS